MAVLVQEKTVEAYHTLRQLARPTLYRANAFRVLGLEVYATERSIKLQAQTVQLREKFGGAVPLAAMPLPRTPPPDGDEMREALHRLGDPEQRFLDEFFWFWPAYENDDALTALAAGNLPQATALWYERCQKDDAHGVALHNIAVLYHASALDVEFLPRTAQLARLQEAYWREAFRCWRGALQHEGCWRRLEARRRQLDDPRLDEGLCARLRDGLPLALLLPNAWCAAAALEHENTDEVLRQKKLLCAAGFAADLADQALRSAVQPLITRLRANCDAARPAAKATPAQAGTVTRTLLAQAGPLLDALPALLPPQDPWPAELRDEVAEAALRCLAAYGEAPGAWEDALRLLEQIRPWAKSSGTQERIDDVRGLLLNCAYS